MKNGTRFFLAAMFGVILITAAWAVPPATHNTNVTVQDAAQTQSASGTISAVDKDAFTITLAPSKTTSVAAVAQQDPPKSMTFAVDKNTTIEGKLAVGANADVTYRDDNGNHVAIGVRVTPPQS
jgi:Cu/Ag efflux protein CusF